MPTLQVAASVCQNARELQRVELIKSLLIGKIGGIMANPNPKPPPLHSRFKPGVSGNPTGRPKIPEELRFVRELTLGEIKRLFAKYARMTRTEIEKAAKATDIPVFEAAIAAILTRAVKLADYGSLAFVLDRTIGRVGSENPEEEDELSKLPNDELIKLVKENLSELEKA